MASLLEFTAFAHTLADAAGVVIRPYFGVAVDVDTKADNSPVSIADREAEAAIRALITEAYPDHGIFGEEFGTSRVASHGEPPRSAYTWVIDPIDGTRAFLAGKKEWGTLIALCEDGVPVLGILDQPVTGERWVGTRGGNAHFYTRASSEGLGAPSLLKAKKMDSSFRWNDDAQNTVSISTTSHRYFTPVQARCFVALADRCADVVEDGDCYAYGLLARGDRDLVVDAGLKPYDILALVPIIEAAGGTITGWDGAPVTLSNYANVLAAGDVELHKVALAILRKSL